MSAATLAQAAAVLLVWANLVLSGCVSPNYPTLKQTRIRVGWSMTGFRNAGYAGRLTLGEKERVTAAYARYEAAYGEALRAAHNDDQAPTPENVKALAFEVIRVVSTIPY